MNVFENESTIGIDLMRSGRDFGQSIEVFIKSRDGTAIGEYGTGTRLGSHPNLLHNCHIVGRVLYSGKIW